MTGVVAFGPPLVGDTWPDIVLGAAQRLVDAGCATDDYPAACVDSVHQNGPYIVMSKSVALVHARPESGAISAGIVCAVCPPTEFGHPTNDPVEFVFAFCSPDADSHVGALKSLAEALRGPLVEDLRHAASVEEGTAILRDRLGVAS